MKKPPAPPAQKFQIAPPTNVLIGLTPSPRPTASGVPWFPSPPPIPFARAAGQAAASPPAPTADSDPTTESETSDHIGLGRVLEAAGEFFETLSNVDPNPRLASEYHERGSAYFRVGRYTDALHDYVRSLAYTNDTDPNQFVYAISCASVQQMIRGYDGAELLYNGVITDDGAPENLVALAQDELRKLADRRQRDVIIRRLPDMVRSDDEHLLATALRQPDVLIGDIPDMVRSDDERLLATALLLLGFYPKIRRTVYLLFVGENEESLEQIAKIQEEAGMPESDRIRTLAGWTAITHVIGDDHWIFVKDRWKEASDSALRGVLAHELAHAELKDAEMAYAVHPDSSHLGFICNERATDLIVIAKGLGNDLLEHRRQMMEEAPDYSLERQVALTSPQEILHLLGSPAATLAGAQFQMKFAVELGQKLGIGSAVVKEEFGKAVPLWEGVIESAPRYAFAHRELAVAYHWMGELPQALRRINAAVELDPSNEEYKRLAADWETALRKQEFNEADSQIKAAAELGQKLGIGDPVVQEEFRKAVPLWERVIETDPKSAHAHRELAVAYQWLEELPQAARYGKMAVELDPSNEEYGQLVASLETSLRGQEEAAAVSQLKAAVELGKKSGRGDPDVQEEFRKAIPLWERIIEYDPRSAPAHWGLAVARHWLGELPQALHYAKMASGLAPSNEEYRGMVAEFETSLRNQEAAEAAISQINAAAELGEKLGSGNPVVQTEFRKAVPLWERVIEYNPRSAPAHRQLAVAHHWLGELPQAVRYANMASELDPSNEEYKQESAGLEAALRNQEVADEPEDGQ